MFDTVKIARNIKEARIKKNMTQMALADALGISFQAVSNWERGSSLPDIGKIEQLCQVLDLDVEELLGMGSAARTVKKVLEEQPIEELSVAEVAEAAPVLLPAQIKQFASGAAENENKIKLSELIGMAPFLEDETLEELCKEAQIDDCKAVEALAPFLSDEGLDILMGRIPEEERTKMLKKIACFLSDESLSKVVKATPPDHYKDLVEIGAFLNDEDFDWMVEQVIQSGMSINIMKEFYPFMDDKTFMRILRHRT